jgi:hypothetical protein
MTETHTGMDDLERSYSPDEPRPLRGYAAALAAYGGLVAAATTAALLRGRRLPETPTPWDVALLGVATHRLSRTLSKDAVTSPLRAPFTRYVGPQGNAELHEEVRGSGVRHAVGELLTCPFCLAQWIATGLGTGLVLAPRPTRLVAGIMSAVAVSDWLQLAYARLCQSLD